MTLVVSSLVRNLEEENCELRARIAFLEQQLNDIVAIPISELPPSGLTLTEYKLLRALLARESLSTDSIMAVLYNGKIRGDSVVKVHVSRLRKWLRANGAEITTQYGSGYFMPAADKLRIRNLLNKGVDYDANRTSTPARALSSNGTALPAA